MARKQAIPLIFGLILLALFLSSFLYVRGELLSNSEKNKEVTGKINENIGSQNFPEKENNVYENKGDFRWLLIVTTLIFTIFLGNFLILRLSRGSVLQGPGNDFELLE